MKSILIVSVCLLALPYIGLSQRTCPQQSTHNAVATDPSVGNPLIAAPVPQIIVIPVVVHVLFRTPEQNISDEQIRSQLAVLNRDFRKKNADTAYIPAVFRPLASDAGIEFRLATIDPSGLPTTGILRKNTGITAFAVNDNIKSSATGGSDGWDSRSYLNIWVGNLSGGVMGYASTPGGAPEKDGLVIRFDVFGTTGAARPPYHKGRTAVHELGHWLGLRHIWGDGPCGDDHIDDTPPQQGPTRGCPSGVVSSCGAGAGGDMYMNFMDFTNDECTQMFTRGQVDKMRTLFMPGGARSSLLLSGKASGSTADIEVPVASAVAELTLYPNPATDEIQLRFRHAGYPGKTVAVYNHLGHLVGTEMVNDNNVKLNLRGFRPGIYYVGVVGSKAMKFIKQ